MLTSSLRLNTTRQMIYASRWAWGFALFCCVVSSVFRRIYVVPTAIIAVLLIGIVAWWHLRGRVVDAARPDPEFGARTRLKLSSYRRQVAMMPMFLGLVLMQAPQHMRDGRPDWFWLLFAILVAVMAVWSLTMALWLPGHPPRDEKPLRRPQEITPARWRRSNAIALSVLVLGGMGGAALLAWNWHRGVARQASLVDTLTIFAGIVLLTSAFLALAVYVGGLVRNPDAWLHPTPKQAQGLISGILLVAIHVPITLLAYELATRPHHERGVGYVMLIWGAGAIIAGVAIAGLAFARARRNQSPAVLPDPYGDPAGTGSSAAPLGSQTPLARADEPRGPYPGSE